MGGQRVRTILAQNGVTVTRDASDEDDKGKCEHRVNRSEGFPSIGAARNAVAQVPGVSHAYISRVGGGTIFYGLVNDEPGQYLPVAQRVVTAILAI